MKITIDKIEHDVSISVGAKNFLVMSNAPIKGIETLCGKKIIELGDTGFMQNESTIKTLKGVTYEFETQENEAAELAAENAELKRAALDFESVLLAAREGLLAVPKPGEDWDAEKWYRTGDTVKYAGATYECEKTCKGREPSTTLLFWKEIGQTTETKPVEIVEWESIPAQADIEVGTIVTHAGKNYKCIAEHKKTVLRQVTNTNFWEQVN